jgi:hypothetical protein
MAVFSDREQRGHSTYGKVGVINAVTGLVEHRIQGQMNTLQVWEESFVLRSRQSGQESISDRHSKGCWSCHEEPFSVDQRSRRLVGESDGVGEDASIHHPALLQE